MLLVTSAFGHMQKQIIPSMVNQLESALSVSIGREREVSRVIFFFMSVMPLNNGVGRGSLDA